MSDKSFDPVIYYFNEKTQQLEELETTVKGNTATTKVTHFSKYILLNRKVFQIAFSWMDVWSTGGYSDVEVVFVIDDSGSMASNDADNQRLSVAKNAIDNLPDNSKIGVVSFFGATKFLTPQLTNDKGQAKSYLTDRYFISYGITNMYDAICGAFSLFQSKDESNLKMIVVLTDGWTEDTYLHSAVVREANNRHIKIYTVGLGYNPAYFEGYLKPLANLTGGAFYLASDAKQLENIYQDINKKIDIEMDSDEDGLSDYYEENMVMFNGMTIKTDKNNPDTDGDGLLDGEEVIQLNYQYTTDKKKMLVTGRITSDPSKEDTDGDGISDEEEKNIETNPMLVDTDGDGLDDGTEFTNWFDPLEQDPDGDGRLDLQEYMDGTDPFSYNKDWYEYVGEFLDGFFRGDFIEETESMPTVMGQVTSSFIPLVDIRDVIGNLVHEDYSFACLSAMGLIPVMGDAEKAASKSVKFIVKNIDDAPKVAGLLEFLNKNFPSIVKVLNKSDDFAEAAKLLSKTDNIKLTRKQAKVVTKAFEDAGLSDYLVKTSNSLKLEGSPLNIEAEVWEDGACKRGHEIDEFVNKHSTGEGLGKNFPVADRLDNSILISTKSLDVTARGYQKSKKLKKTLERYAEALKNIEKKYFKGANEFRWGNKKLSKNDYNKKALEIILPNTIITEDALNILKDFKTTTEQSGMEVWYRITK